MIAIRRQHANNNPKFRRPFRTHTTHACRQGNAVALTVLIGYGKKTAAAAAAYPLDIDDTAVTDMQFDRLKEIFNWMARGHVAPASRTAPAIYDYFEEHGPLPGWIPKTPIVPVCVCVCVCVCVRACVRACVGVCGPLAHRVNRTQSILRTASHTSMHTDGLGGFGELVGCTLRGTFEYQ